MSMATRMRDSRRDQEPAKGRRPWLLAVGLLLLVAIVAVPSFGYYRVYVQPPTSGRGA